MTTSRTRDVSTLVVGAGHAGLAVSRCLTERSIDHVLLERGEVANSWATERWDSLRLLTPNWMNRLPGYRYDGDDPDGFMTMPEVIDYIRGYAKVVDAPVQTCTTVTSLGADDGRFRVETTDGTWTARSVVLASGACNVPAVPEIAARVPEGIDSITPAEYRNPDQLADGGVLIAGASATGIQLAEEIHRSGRPVTLAVGGHVRAPRTYRGRDILWWLDATGILDEGYEDIDDLVRARNIPSFQLVGTPEHTTLDLNSLQAMGVRLVGKLAEIRDGTALFSGSLRNQCTLADLKLGRLLDSIDEWATANGLDDECPPPERFDDTYVEESPPLMLDLHRGEIKTVLWATGYRPDFSWLDVPVLDHKGYVRHDGGVTPLRGLYVIGMPFLRRRKSTLIDGAEGDARAITTHLAGYLAETVSIH